MIQVTVAEKNNEISAFTISGHANSGPYGYDLVCAAVSAVTFGAVNAVLELAKINLEIDQAGEGGYLAVNLPPNGTQNRNKKQKPFFKQCLFHWKKLNVEFIRLFKLREIKEGPFYVKN